MQVQLWLEVGGSLRIVRSDNGDDEEVTLQAARTRTETVCEQQEAWRWWYGSRL